MSTADRSDRLSLGDCPACGYALQGLPEAGACPECGRTYDKQVIVLHGWARGSLASIANASPHKLSWLLSVQLVMILTLAFVGTLLYSPVFIAIIGASVAFIVVMLWKRWSNRLPAPIQVHLSSAGCVQLDARRATGGATLTPWEGINAVRLRQSPEEERYDLALCRIGPWWKPQPLPPVDAVVICTPEQAQVLRERIDRWLDEASDEAPIVLH